MTQNSSRAGVPRHAIGCVAQVGITFGFFQKKVIGRENADCNMALQLSRMKSI
jgi:hypothetical protein